MTTRQSIGPRQALAALIAVVIRPGLWATALVQWRRLTPRDWWRTAPYLPVPDPDYLRFRLTTQYGYELSATAPTALATDVVTYLEWCRSTSVR